MKRGVLYFALVFGVGFILGTIRVLWVVPQLGVRAAELIEAPLMLAATCIAARFVTRRFRAARKVEYLHSGFVALILLLIMEFSVVLGIQGLSVREYLAERDPVAGAVYVAMLIVFALMPWLLGPEGFDRRVKMNLGAFSLSLNVRDLEASRDFYAKLGFEPVGGNPDEKWLILRNGEHVIGLFQGMFEKNMLTFNPGWDQHGNEAASFTDIRELQKKLKEAGVELASEADESTVGPASLMLVDPDGNPILLDQHQ